MRAVRLCLYALLFWFHASSNHLIGQSSSASAEVLAPTASVSLGKVDSSALDQINQHLLATGNTPWTGMQATGQITYGSDKTSYPATLTILGSNRFRLDVQTASGTQSIRINGRLGKMQSADGRIDALLPDTASSGLVQFQVLRTVDLTRRSVSLTDQGSSTVDGLKLRRVTLTSGMTSAKAGRTSKTTATDFYFDPQTHQLIKSVNSIRLIGSGCDQIRVITYGDYREVNGMMIPFLFTQSLDGQLQWTLRLSDAQISTDKQSTTFEF